MFLKFLVRCFINKEKEFIKKLKEKVVWNVEGDINKV